MYSCSDGFERSEIWVLFGDEMWIRDVIRDYWWHFASLVAHLKVKWIHIIMFDIHLGFRLTDTVLEVGKT